MDLDQVDQQQVDQPGLNPFWFGLSRGSKIGWMLFNSILLVIFAAKGERKIPL